MRRVLCMLILDAGSAVLLRYVVGADESPRVSTRRESGEAGGGRRLSLRRSFACGVSSRRFQSICCRCKRIRHQSERVAVEPSDPSDPLALSLPLFPLDFTLSTQLRNMVLRHLDLAIRPALRAASTTASRPRLPPFEGIAFAAPPSPSVAGQLAQVYLPDMHRIEHAEPAPVLIVSRR